MKKTTSIILSILCVFIALMLSLTYRPFVYSSNLKGIHWCLANAIGNIFAIPAAVFFSSGINSNKIRIYKSIPMAVITFCAFELLGLFGIHGTFDIWDIVASVISGVFLYLILMILKIKTI